MTNLSAVAWSLHAPSASGGKEYRLFLLDNILVIGWGSVRGTMQYKVYRNSTAESVRAYALEQTALKERKGYVLTLDPVSVSVFDKAWGDSYLSKFIGHRGGSTELDNMFAAMFAAS